MPLFPAVLGSGQVLASTFSAANFTMTTAATLEDVSGLSLTFTPDGRPVRLVMTPCCVSQDQASLKLITLTLCRSSDNAIQETALVTTSVSGELKSMQIDTGPLLAWPSDSVAFVIGTPLTVKLRLTSGSSSKATLGGGSTPYCLYAVTA